jgi:hypothetical protein
LADPPCPGLTQLIAAIDHVESCAQGALWIILMGQRGAKYGHHRIANEFLDKAVVALNGVTEHLKESVLEGTHVLRV